MKGVSRSIHGAVQANASSGSPPALQPGASSAAVHCCVAAMLAVVELCWSGSDLCCQNIGCFADASSMNFYGTPTVGVFLALATRL